SVTREGRALRWRGRVTSPRGADEIQLAIPPSVNLVSASVDGVPVPPPAPKLARWYGGWAVYRLHAGPEGVEVEMEVATPGALEMVLADRSPDLPPEAARVAAARPRGVVTVQEGDGTLFTRRVRIEAPEPPVR
ncbi:MAG TPA: hypothetical protein VFM45_07310, partial [Anaeromyxobacteraceae bacterium]|nr:hypothetical protein [Anaeromyxobacteraceae bacterium]